MTNLLGKKERFLFLEKKMQRRPWIFSISFSNIGRPVLFRILLNLLKNLFLFGDRMKTIDHFFKGFSVR